MQKSLWVAWIAIAALLSGEQTTAQEEEAAVAEPDGVRSMSGSKPKTPSESADETEKPSIGEQLIEASSSGDIRTVRAMAKANAYAPASANALKARMQAKANGHRRVVAVLDREIDEYYKSGAAYAAAAESLLKKAKEGLQEDPEYLTSFEWRLQVRGTKSAFAGFYRDAKKDPENALHPLAVRFDHEEFARYIDAEIDKLDGNHSPP